MDKTLLKHARRLNARNGGPNCPIPPIILMTDDHRMPDPEPVLRALPRDSMVIFRHYGLEAADRARLGARLRSICRAKGIPFLVANDVALALKLDADGIHFPEYRALTDPGIYCRIPQNLLRTSACHSVQTLHQLTLLPTHVRPDGVLISPVFTTKSHQGSAHLEMGQACRISNLCRTRALHSIALGGINGGNITKLGICAITSIAGIGFADILNNKGSR